MSSSVPGFDFRYRLHGGSPTINAFVFMNTETLTRGDILNFEDGLVDLGVPMDAALLGCALETLDGEAGKTYIRVITDRDAVYAVEDPEARTQGDLLELSGTTGRQGVATSLGSALMVVADSRPGERRSCVSPTAATTTSLTI